MVTAVAERPESAADGAAEDDQLTLRSLCVWYGRQQVVHDVSLAVARGSGIAVVGRNGVGKTTLLRGITSSFGVRASGSVVVGGHELVGQRTQRIARQGVSLVPTDRRIFPLTVEENLVLGLRGRADVSAKIEEVTGYFPILRSRLRQRGDTLSGGEQQALAIARALMADPRFLLLDEPSEGLAPMVVEALEEALATVQRNALVGLILVDRNIRLIQRLASTVVGMNRGRLIYRCSAEEFVPSEELQRQLLAPATSETADVPEPKAASESSHDG